MEKTPGYKFTNDCSAEMPKMPNEVVLRTRGTEKCGFEADEQTGSECSFPDKRFKEELQQLINRLSIDNETNTPDFILAQHLCDCLETFKKSTERRAEWYGEDY